MSLRVLRASLRKEMLINIRSWRVLAYSLFLSAVILLGAVLPQDSFPYELSVSQGPLVLLLVVACSFIFCVDAVSREHEKGTAPLMFGTQANRGVILAAKAMVCLIAWLFTVMALSIAYLSAGLGGVFATLWLIRLGCSTLLFLALLCLQLMISAGVKGRGAAFAGLVVVLFIFFTSGYLEVGLDPGVLLISPGYHEYLTVTDAVDGTLDNPLPAIALAIEAAVFYALAGWLFHKGEVAQ